MNKYLKLRNRIKKNEGFKNFAYYDSLGFATIGYGHLIKDTETHLLRDGFSKKLLTKIFDEDFNNAINHYKKTYKNVNHPKNIKEVLIEMIFQLGIVSQKKFIKMNRYLKKNNLFMAALEMKNSIWYTQTPKRVDELINILLK